MKLSSDDIRTISAALSDGIKWRDSLAEAHHRTGPHAVAASLAADRYERLHVKLVGIPSAHAAERERFARMKPVSIFDIE